MIYYNLIANIRHSYCFTGFSRSCTTLKHAAGIHPSKMLHAAVKFWSCAQPESKTKHQFNTWDKQHQFSHLYDIKGNKLSECTPKGQHLSTFRVAIWKMIVFIDLIPYEMPAQVTILLVPCDKSMTLSPFSASSNQSASKEPLFMSTLIPRLAPFHTLRRCSRTWRRSRKARWWCRWGCSVYPSSSGRFRKTGPQRCL